MAGHILLRISWEKDSQLDFAPLAYGTARLNEQVVVRETHGSDSKIVRQFSVVSEMQRKGHLRYSMTGRKYSSCSDNVSEPKFLQATLHFGTTNSITFYGGAICSAVYYKANMRVRVLAIVTYQSKSILFSATANVAVCGKTSIINFVGNNGCLNLGVYLNHVGCC